MAECIVAIERSVCENAQSLSYLAKYCYNIAAIYNINHYIFNIYYYLYFSQLGSSWADGLRDLYEILLFFELADLNFTDQPFPTQPIAYMKINKLERTTMHIKWGNKGLNGYLPRVLIAEQNNQINLQSLFAFRKILALGLMIC